MARLTETHLVVSRSLSIPLAEIELRASRSSGPGGQHANKTESRVEAVFDVLMAPSLGEGQRARLTAKLGSVARAMSQDARSQTRNREIALIRLGDKLEQALKVQRSRVATKPTAASRQRRIAAKQARSGVKATRRKPSAED